MRKSLKDLPQNMVRKIDDYPGLPEELKEYCYWIADSGYCIMAIPEALLKEHFGSFDLWECECPVPVKYVLEKGYVKFEEYIVVQIEYSNAIGLVVPEGYDEY